MSWAEIITSSELGLIYGIVAIGIYFTFRIIDFPDLTCDGSFVTGAATCAVALKAGIDPFISLLLAFVAGAACGLCTGVLHVYFGISNLLSGILTAFMLYSVNLKIMGGIPNIALINEHTIFDRGYPLIVLIIVTSLVWLACGYLLITDFGLALRSIGQNKKLAMIQGIRIGPVLIFTLILSNALIGLAGGLFCQHQNFADISQGIGTIIIGLAAIIIGEKLLPSRSTWLTVLSCIIGSVTYRCIITVSLHNQYLGLESADLNLVTGIIVILIMVLPSYKLIWRRSC